MYVCIDQSDRLAAGYRNFTHSVVTAVLFVPSCLSSQIGRAVLLPFTSRGSPVQEATVWFPVMAAVSDKGKAVKVKVGVVLNVSQPPVCDGCQHPQPWLRCLGLGFCGPGADRFDFCCAKKKLQM